MSEEYKFTIDAFRPVASWMSEIELRLNRLDAENRELRKEIERAHTRLQPVERFTTGVRLVLGPEKADFES